MVLAEIQSAVDWYTEGSLIHCASENKV
jgi:hypothetical protein